MTCKQTYIGALFLRAPVWNQLRCSTTAKQIVYIFKDEHCSVIKRVKYKYIKHRHRSTTLKLSKKEKTDTKTTYCMIPFISYPRKGKTTGKDCRSVGPWAGSWGRRSVSKWHRGLFWVIEMFPILVVSPPYSFAKTHKIVCLKWIHYYLWKLFLSKAVKIRILTHVSFYLLSPPIATNTIDWSKLFWPKWYSNKQNELSASPESLIIQGF